MKICVITDELSADLDAALELAVELGFDGVELRGIGETRYPRVSALEARLIPQFLSSYRLPVVGISAGLFKIPYPEPAPPIAPLRWDEALAFGDETAALERFAFHTDDLLPRTIEAARTIGAPMVNCFAFDRGSAPPGAPAPDAVVLAFRQAAKAAAAAGLTLTIENEATTWAATSADTAALVERIGEPNVGITWDPANAFRAGEDQPFPGGWEHIRKHVRHVHVKNAAYGEGGTRLLQYDGVVDWPGQIAGLKRAGYQGYLSVETHQRPKIGTTRKYLKMLQSLLGE